MIQPVKYSLIISIIILITSLVVHVQYATSSVDKSPTTEPTTDFSFIKRYICISDLLGKEQWLTSKDKSFNEKGVILSNGKMHPVNLCHYALFCYDEFNSTGNIEFRDAFLIQARALLDSGYYHNIDEKRIAFPYHINFRELKPPWYSALAQAEAISVLIRYYALTHDRKALPVIVKSMNFMLSPQDEHCGTKSITPEGNEWYEEYPNSVREKQVLNGFFIVMIALHEYENFFPHDTIAHDLLNKSIQTVKESFRFYDTGFWLRYNRGDKRLVANGYMKWQVMQLKFLYQLTGDIYFKHLMMLISTYCFNKPYDTPGSKMRDYDFAVPLTLQKNGSLIYEGKYVPYDLKYLKPLVNSSYNFKNTDYNKLYDNNTNTFVTLKTNPVLKNNESHINFYFDDVHSFGSLKIHFSGNDSVMGSSISLFYDNPEVGIERMSVPSKSIVKESKSLLLNFDQIHAQSVHIALDHNYELDSVRVSEITFTKPLDLTDSDFHFYTTRAYKTSGNEAVLRFDYIHMKDIAVFYKTASTEKLLEKELWSSHDVRREVPVIVRANEGNFVQFLIICEPSNKDAYIRNIKVRG